MTDPRDKLPPIPNKWEIGCCDFNTPNCWRKIANNENAKNKHAILKCYDLKKKGWGKFFDFGHNKYICERCLSLLIEEWVKKENQKEEAEHYEL